MNYYEASQIQLKAHLALNEAAFKQRKQPKPKRPKPQTPYKGSWADVMEKERQRTSREAEKDTRPSSVMLDGIVTLRNGVKVEFTSNGRI